MGDENEGGNLSVAQPETAKVDMADNLSLADYALMDRKRRDRVETSESEPKKEQQEEKADEDTKGEENADPEVKAEDADQPEELEADDESEAEEDVLSKFDPKAKEKIQKRINGYTKRAKEAEEKANAAEAERAKLAAEVERLTQAKPAPVPVPVVSDDPNDLTAKATSDEDIAKVERQAREMLELIDDGELSINRAIAKDEETVKLSDGQTYRVADLVKAKKLAKAHIERFVPARRAFLQHRQAAIETARAKFPAMFKADTPEHLALQDAFRSFPALQSVPHIELMYGYALRGLAAERHEQEAAAKAAKVKPASSEPAKTASGGKATAAPARPKVGSAERDMDVKLAKAKAEMERTGSIEALTEYNKLKALSKSR